MICDDSEQAEKVEKCDMTDERYERIFNQLRYNEKTQQEIEKQKQ
jgi:hypothetical protein